MSEVPLYVCHGRGVLFETRTVCTAAKKRRSCHCSAKEGVGGYRAVEGVLGGAGLVKECRIRDQGLGFRV